MERLEKVALMFVDKSRNLWEKMEALVFPSLCHLSLSLALSLFLLLFN
jgi:hypothetical protein